MLLFDSKVSKQNLVRLSPYWRIKLTWVPKKTALKEKELCFESGLRLKKHYP